MAQTENETIAQFVTRLKGLSVYCNFGDREDDNILDQLREKSSIPEVRRDLIKEGDGLTVEKALAIGRAVESTMQHTTNHESVQTGAIARVTQVSQPGDKNGNMSSKQITDRQRLTCYRCGTASHFAKSDECPARGKNCSKCGLEGHFSKVCNTKDPK
jgi:hypothetical protein